jgi:hypothetical protein
MDESAVTVAATPAEAVKLRKRGCRHLGQVVVKFLPAVEFAVPVFFEFESQSSRVSESVLTKAGEVLAAV